MNTPRFFKDVSLVMLAAGENDIPSFDGEYYSRDGILLVSYLYYQLSPLFSEISMIAGRKMDVTEFPGKIIHREWDPDVPIAGVAAALEDTGNSWVFIVDADIVHFDYELLKRICYAPRGRLKGIVPKINGRYEPLFALYHKKILPVIRRDVERKSHITHERLKAWKCHIIEIHEDKYRLALFKLKTPGDLLFAQRQGWADA